MASSAFGSLSRAVGARLVRFIILFRLFHLVFLCRVSMQPQQSQAQICLVIIPNTKNTRKYFVVASLPCGTGA